MFDVLNMLSNIYFIHEQGVSLSAGPPLGGATRLRGCAASLLSTVPWSLSPELRVCSVTAGKLISTAQTNLFTTQTRVSLFCGVSPALSAPPIFH